MPQQQYNTYILYQLFAILIVTSSFLPVISYKEKPQVAERKEKIQREEKTKAINFWTLPLLLMGIRILYFL